MELNDLSNFWNYYIIVCTVLAILFCVFLITVVSGKIDKDSKNEMVNHVWDGNLSEYNNPLPAWWRNMFAILLVFSVGYLIWYPGLGAFKGVGGWSQLGQYDQEMKELNAKTQPLYDQFAAMSVEDVANDPKAMGMAQRLFLNNCAQCHGSDAGGSYGYPRLTKKAGWAWGGTPDDITATITEGRSGYMQPLQLNESDTTAVVEYTRSLSGLDHNAAVLAQGKQAFEDNCASCHKSEGTGSADLGAPDLTDNVWVWGSSVNAIRDAIVNGRSNDMPAADPAILSPGKIRLLTSYIVHLENQ
jgi:cytochrome c oxidase cbb3-type subunit 3